MPQPQQVTSSSTSDHHSTTHIPALDGLRGIAILLVIVAHSILVEPQRPFDDFVARVSLSGWMGVDLFFVLSGFLITGILLDTKDREHYLKNFFVRRALRILPLYYGSLLILFIAMPLLHPLLAAFIHTSAGLAQFVNAQEQLHDSQAWYWLHATNLLVLKRGTVAALPVATGQFWSLAVEEQFYLVWPFVVLFAGRKTCAWVFTGCVALGVALRFVLSATNVPPDVIYTFTLTRCDPLALGALVALAWRSPRWWLRVRTWAPWTLVASSAGIVSLWIAHGHLNSRDRIVQEYGLILIGIGFASIVVRIIAAIGAPAPGGVLRSSILRSLGKYSYGIYIIHQAVLVLAWHIFPWGRVPTIYGSTILEQLLLTATVTATSLGVAALIWRFYELPFTRLKERLTYRVASPRAAPAAPHLSGATQ